MNEFVAGAKGKVESVTLFSCDVGKNCKVENPHVMLDLSKRLGDVPVAGFDQKVYLYRDNNDISVPQNTNGVIVSRSKFFFS